MTLAILNVGEGDTRLSFDPGKPEELARTKRIITDMLKLGYAILVKVGEEWRRAIAFDSDACEYVISDVPAEESAPLLKTKRRGRRVKAASTRAVSVARSAGGMSAAADSIEMQNLEKFDPCAETRNKLRALARFAGEWAGIPMPLEDAPLVVEPKYRAAAALTSAPAEPPREDHGCTLRNRFYLTSKRYEILVWSEPDGRIEWGIESNIHSFPLAMHTMAASSAWGIEQESYALQTLAELLPHHAFKKYLLTGMFVERSKRSGVYYFFRRLKPTVAASGATGEMKILAALCMHPIAYYQGTWAGAMAPTDDVIAHLMLMRGDESMYWRRCNQHPAWRKEAGL